MGVYNDLTIFNILCFADSTDYSAGVKHVVVTSSTAAVNRVEPQKITVTEADWNDQAVQKVKDSEAPPFIIYQASKVLAERAAWAAAEGAKWSLTTLNPPWVFGVTPFVVK